MILQRTAELLDSGLSEKEVKERLLEEGAARMRAYKAVLNITKERRKSKRETRKLLAQLTVSVLALIVGVGYAIYSLVQLHKTSLGMGSHNSHP